MSKPYSYKNLSYPCKDNENINFSVEFISDGNMGTTSIKTPNNKNYQIKDQGSQLIGTGKDLRTGITVGSSSIINPIPEENEIRIQYKINGELLVEHVNPTSEEKEPIIILYIQFPNL